MANSSGLFEESDIKIRMRPLGIYAVGGGREDFIHTFAWLMRLKPSPESNRRETPPSRARPEAGRADAA